MTTSLGEARGWFLIDSQGAEGSGTGGTITCHFLSTVTVADDTAVVHVVLPLTRSAGGYTVSTHAKRFGAHRQRVRVETVGAFVVESVKYGREIQIAVPHDDAFVKTEDNCSPLVDAIGYFARRLSGVISKVKTHRSVLHRPCDAAEGARSVGIHGRGQCDVLMRGIVEYQIAGARGIFMLRITAR